MWEKNLGQRLILIGVVLLCAFALIGNPKESLRPGLDIAGGVSLIFEIDDTGLEEYQNLAEDMKRLLQKRVDPQGVFDLTWRVHGRNRLEVQMPLPPPKAKQLRREYADARDDLFSSSVGRGQLEEVFQKSGAERKAAVNELARGSAERKKLLEEASAIHDAYVAALQAYRAGPQEVTPVESSQPPNTQAASAPARAKSLEDLEIALRDAEENLEDACEAFLATNLDQNRFQEILELDQASDIRRDSLKLFKEQHPDLAGKIEIAVEKHDEWAQNRGKLDGPADLQRLLRGAGVLEFRILAMPSPENVTKYDRYRRQLAERGSSPAPGDTMGWFKVDNPMAFFDLKTPTDLKTFEPTSLTRFVAEKHGQDYYILAQLGAEDGLLGENKTWQLRNASIDRDRQGRLCVNFVLDVVGGQLFEELTRKNIDKPLCILVDDIAYSAPNIASKIRSHGQITGDFSFDKVNYLVRTMQAGSLPARLKETPISERTIGSSLGATNRDKAFRAGLIGVIVVALIMAVYYAVSGLIANVALLMNIILVLAIMAMLQARFTLAGIAGVILTIGMSVDANVLIFERMREEKERGSSLRLIIKNGYDKAFSTIIDANITTMLTCVILYYVGSEEIKGFGLTLGWGIVMSMFTALFVTRTVFTLLIKYGLLKNITMLHFIGVPKIDWYAKRKFFLPLSLIVVLVGLALLVERGYKNFLDVEFLGGVSAEVEITPASAGQETLDDIKIAALLQSAGESISADAGKLAQAEVEPVVGLPNAYRILVPGVANDRLAAMLTEPLEDQKWLQRGGLDSHGDEGTVSVRLQGEVNAEQIREFVRGLPETLEVAGSNIADASVGSVVEAGFDQQAGRFWHIATTERNRRLVQHALVTSLGDRLQRQQRINYVFHGDAQGRPFPIDDRRLENVVLDPTFPAGVGAEPLTDFLGGAALYFTNLDPPQCVDPKVPGSIPDRLKNMRLQPGYQDYPYRKFKVIGVQSTGQDAEGHKLYSSAVVVLVDEHYSYSDDKGLWETEFAQKELGLTQAALETEQALRKVSQFKPQIAKQSTQQASLALLLSWAMIIGYLWIRFGRPMYGIAGVCALIHDVCIALAFVGFSGWIGGANHPLGAALLIDDFKINMTIVAAFLTIIGYSVNDTIVVFDRIRETRGRLGRVTQDIINSSINQCMSRTLMTSITTFVVLLIMYIFGGSSIRGFNFCMMIGVLTGTYSSIAIATPLLMMRFGRRARPATA